MVVFVFTAFIGAHSAGFFTDCQERSRQFRVTKKQFNSLHTQLGTIAIKLDAPGHHRYIFFIKASCTTRFTGKRTIQEFADKVIVVC
jgi:hypothetical protein